jgi:uncharacterized membrane protein YbhN (UPF0104 family)
MEHPSWSGVAHLVPLPGHPIPAHRRHGRGVAHVAHCRRGCAPRGGGASFAIESLLLIGWATLIGAIFIPSSVVSTPTRVVLATGAAVALATLPWSLRVLGGRMKRLAALAPDKLQSKEMVEAVGLFGLNSTLRAARFVALAAALLPLTAGDVPLVLGAGYAGVIAGMIGITPAGLGVREGVIVAVLAREFGVGDAAALAVLLRAWDLVFELGFLAVATWVGRHRPPVPAIRSSP